MFSSLLVAIIPFFLGFIFFFLITEVSLFFIILLIPFFFIYGCIVTYLLEVKKW